MAVNSERGERVRLHRDGATWLLYAQLSLFAYFLYGFTPSVTLLRDEEHIRDGVAALHGTAYAVGVIVIGSLGGRIIARLGRTRTMWMFMGCLCVSVGIYISAAYLPVTLLGALLAGGCASGIVITVAAALMDHHGPAGPAAVTEANAVAAAVGLFAPLAIGGAVHLGWWGWRPAMLVMIAGAAILYALRGHLLPGTPRAGPEGGAAPPAVRPPGAGPTAVLPPAVGPSAAASRRQPRLSRQFWLSYTVVVLCVGIEFSLTLWCAQLLRDRSGLSPAAAATGVTAIVGGMCLGRIIGSRIARRRDVDWILARAFVLTAFGFALFWFSTVGWLAFAGLALCGLGMAVHYPLGISRSIRAADGHSDLASARVSVGTGIAIAGAPFLLGFLSDLITVRYAFLLVPLLLALASAALMVAHRGRTTAARLEAPAEAVVSV